MSVEWNGEVRCELSDFLCYMNDEQIVEVECAIKDLMEEMGVPLDDKYFRYTRAHVYEQMDKELPHGLSCGHVGEEYLDDEYKQFELDMAMTFVDSIKRKTRNYDLVYRQGKRGIIIC